MRGLKPTDSPLWQDSYLLTGGLAPWPSPWAAPPSMPPASPNRVKGGDKSGRVVSTLSDSVRPSVKGKCPLCRLPC